MNLKIQNPCDENWEAMTPTEQGRFCQSCQKEVVDFTSFSLPDIKLYIEQHTGELCGNFEETQMEAFNLRYQALPTPSRIRQWAAAAVLTAVVTLPSFGQDTLPVAPVRVHTPLSSNYVPYNEANVLDKVTLSGQIWDPTQEEAVVTAILSITGTDVIGTTDAKGYFSLQVPISQKTMVLVINHVNYGTNTYEIIPNQARAGLLIELKAPVQEKTAAETNVSVKKYKKRRKQKFNKRGRVIMGCPAW
ncbi:MAG: hypothetical protein ACRBFS_27115 [Aureispira sp.]